MPAPNDLRDVSCRIRRLQRKMRRRCGKDDAQEGSLSAKTANLALMVYVFSGHNLDMAAAFVAFRLRYGDDRVEDARCMFEEVYAREPTPRIVELMNDQCLATRSMRVMTHACTFIVHRQLYEWVCEQNCKRGVAPSRAQMTRQASSLVPTDCPLEVQALVRAPLCASPRRQRKWLRRFRQLWGARVGSLQALSTLSVSEMQEKAGWGPLVRSVRLTVDMFGKYFNIWDFLLQFATSILGAVFQLPKWWSSRSNYSFEE